MAFNGLTMPLSGEVNLRENGPIFFRTNNLPNGLGLTQRLIVTKGNFRDKLNNIITPNVARIGINYDTNDPADYEPMSS